MAAKYSHLLLSFTLILFVTTLGHAEIHRAVKNKHHIRHDRTDFNKQQEPRVAEASHYSKETWIYSMGSAGLVGLSGIFPLLVIPLEAGKALRKGAAAARLKLLLSFAVGGLLGDVFLHLLPEAWAHLDSHTGHLGIGLWVLAGILLFLVIEKLFPDQDDDDDEEGEEQEKVLVQSTKLHQKEKKGTSPRQRKNKKTTNGSVQNGSVQNGSAQNGHVQNGSAHAANVQNGNASKSKSNTKDAATESGEERIKTSGWLNLMANVIDNFTHGLAVGGSYCVSHKVGVVTTIAILLHEVPHEVGDFAILLRSGFDRWRAAKAQILTASGGLIGAITALSAESAQAAGDSTAWILPFTSGGFLYIALVTVVPDLLKEKCPWESLKQVVLLVCGIVTMALVTLCFD